MPPTCLGDVVVDPPGPPRRPGGDDPLIGDEADRPTHDHAGPERWFGRGMSAGAGQMIGEDDGEKRDEERPEQEQEGLVVAEMHHRGQGHCDEADRDRGRSH